MKQRDTTSRCIHSILLGSILLCAFLLPFFSETVIAAGYINVYNPSGGQIWYQGDTYAINWYGSGIGDSVKIELYRSGYYSTIATNTPNDGSYAWTVPSDLPTSGASYRIRISNISDDVSSYSGYFTIQSRSITVTYPTSSTTWYQGGLYSIQWSPQNIGYYVSIDLYKSGSFYETITSNAYSYSSSSSHSWEVPTDIPAGSAYSIKITSNTYPNVYDYSSTFTIEERTITITSPTAGETWWAGEYSTITWTSDISGYVSISLYKDDVLYTSNIASTYNSGSYQWALPSTLPYSTHYQIKITSSSYTTVYDYSDYFTIDQRYINLTTPTFWEALYTGEEYLIKWDSKNAGSYVQISLYQNYYEHSIITSNTSNDGGYLWDIPSTIPSGSSYQIKIFGLPNKIVEGSGELFTISQRSITIYSPSGGETWYLGETYAIQWSSENIGTSVTIELFENGELYSTIAQDISNDGSYQWTIPQNLDLHAQYSIKISSQDYEEVFEFNDGYVSVEKPLIQSWLGDLILILVAVISLGVVVFLIKTKRIPLPPLHLKKSQPEKKDNEKLSVQPSVQQEHISHEEYDKIWEE